jgi:cellobiose-specific phosphotransferase system component IIB
LEAQLLGDSNNSEALKKEILKHRSNYWKNKSEAVKPGNEDYGFKPDNSFIEKTLNEGQRAILPLVSGAAQMTAGAFPPIAGNVFQEQEGPGKGTSEASFRELKQIRDETIKVISQIRDKYENETGTFDLSKIEPADKYRYQEALDIYQKSVAQMQEIGKEKLGMNQGNQVGNSEVVSKFLDFSKKVRGLLKPPERNVVKRTRAK